MSKVRKRRREKRERGDDEGVQCNCCCDDIDQDGNTTTPGCLQQSLYACGDQWCGICKICGGYIRRKNKIQPVCPSDATITMDRNDGEKKKKKGKKKTKKKGKKKKKKTKGGRKRKRRTRRRRSRRTKRRRNRK